MIVWPTIISEMLECELPALTDVEAKLFNDSVFPTTLRAALSADKLQEMENICLKFPNGLFHRTLGYSKFHAGNFEEAIRHIEVSLEKTPEELGPATAYPGDLAFLAISRRNLGHESEAEIFRNQFDDLMEQERQFPYDGWVNMSARVSYFESKVYAVFGKPMRPRLVALRAISFLREGKVNAAIAELDVMKNQVEVALNAEPKDGKDLYDFACAYAVASTKIIDKSREFAERAIELLLASVAAGLSETDLIVFDENLASLRDRPDFKELVKSINSRKELSK